MAGNHRQPPRDPSLHPEEPEASPLRRAASGHSAPARLRVVERAPDEGPEVRKPARSAAAVAEDERREAGAPEPLRTPPPISQIDEYRITESVGRGGMGQVFLGHDSLLDRPVAVKFLGTRTPSEKLRKRFLIEARALAKLQHPNVVAIFRAGIANNLPYLISELVPGQSLDKLPKPIHWKQALRIGIDLTRGLCAVHKQGILHRDIKPANAILTPDGTAKLLDFGLAKLDNELDDVPVGFVTDSAPSLELPPLRRAPLALPAPLAAPLPSAGLESTAAPEGESHAHVSATAPPLAETEDGPQPGRPRPPSNEKLTDSEILIGTPAYMPPEMWLGAPATELSDIYLLGELIYELCCGHPPHSYRRRHDQRRATLYSDAMPLAKAAPMVNTRLAELVDRCLRRDPKQRPQTALEVLTQLESILADPTDEATKQRRRWRALFAQFLPLLIAALVVTGAAIATWRGAQPAEENATPLTRPRPRVALLGLHVDPGSPEKLSRFAVTFSELLFAELAAGQQLFLFPSDVIEKTKLQLKLDISSALVGDTLPKLRTLLGPDLVVFGGVRTERGDPQRVYITLVVKNAQTGLPVAATQTEGAAEKLFEMVDFVGAELRRQLGLPTLSMRDRRGLQAELPRSLESAQLYAAAKALSSHFDFVGARSLLSQVVAMEPDYPLGHLAYADVLQALGNEEQARAEAGLAFQLSAQLPAVERSLIEARFRESTGEWQRAFGLYKALRTTLNDSEDYALYLANAQLRAGLPGEAQTTLSELRKSPTRASSDPRIDLAEAKVQMELSNFSAALQILGRVISRAESVSASLLLADALLLDSFTRTNLNDHAGALKSAYRARDLFASAGNLYGKADSLGAASTAAVALGDYELATQLNETALVLLLELGNGPLIAVHLGNMAALFYDRGQPALAVARAQSGLLLARQIGNREAIQQALGTLGAVSLQRGELAAAEQYLEQAQRESPQSGDPRMAAWIAWQRAELHLEQDHMKEAETLHRSALAQRESHRLSAFIPESQVALAALLLDRTQGKFSEAEQLLRQAVKQFAAGNNADGVAWANATLSDALAQAGRAEEARETFLRALTALSESKNFLFRIRGLSALASAATGIRLGPEVTQKLYAQLERAIEQARSSELLGSELDLSVRLAILRSQPGAPEGTLSSEVVCALRRRANERGLLRISRLAGPDCLRPASVDG